MSASWNFARRPFRDDRPAYAAAAVLFFAGAVLLAVNVRLYTAYRRGVSDVTAEIATLEARQRAAEERGSKAKAALSSYRLSSMADESRELARIVAERRFAWTGLLARLERTLPSDVGILRLQPQFDKDGQVTLDLQLAARSREAVVPTLAALAKDPAFAQVELRSESQPEGTTADPFQFQVFSHYSPAPAAEAAPAAGAKPPERSAGTKKPAAGGAGRQAPPARAAASAPTPAPNPLLARVPTPHKPAPRGPLNPVRPRSASQVNE